MTACRERGSVLMTVIWSLLMLAVFLLALTRQVSAELTFGVWLMDRTSSRHLAKAGVERAFFEIRNDKFQTFDSLNENWAVNSKVFQNQMLGMGTFEVVCDGQQGYSEKDQEFRFGMCDESARLNLNTATPEMLTSFFRALEVSNEVAESLSHQIVDWRDTDGNRMPHGAEANDYKSLKHPYEPRNGKFLSVEEARLIKGMTDEIYKKMEPYVTVYTSGKINFNTAPEIVLQSFGLSRELTSKVSSFRAGADGRAGTKDDEVFQYVDGITPVISASVPFTPEEFEGISNAISQNLVAVNTEMFRIYSIGRIMHKPSRFTRITCVVDRDGLVHYWREE